MDQAPASGIYLKDKPRQNSQRTTQSIEAPLAQDVTPPSERSYAMEQFLRLSGWDKAERVSLGQDASTRSYTRLVKAGHSVLLMDAPRLEAPVAPLKATTAERKALGWNATARLAACRIDAFVCVGTYLASLGLSVPKVYAFDVGGGFALVEDFGPNVFAQALKCADPSEEIGFYRQTGQALAVVYNAGVPAELMHRGLSWPVFQYDRLALEGSVDLFFDWQPKYDPAVRLTEADRLEWEALTDGLIVQALQSPRAFTVRDVMSENLIWLPERQGVKRVGFLDFQDALAGWASWDFAMLIQDARRDVGPEAAAAAIKAFLDDTGLSEAAFKQELAILGAINALRILGVFARLVWRDGKPKYAVFMAREWNHLRSCLKHPALSELDAFLRDRCKPLAETP
jgi:aminoglycoside/choline kinase family phosphotransferase